MENERTIRRIRDFCPFGSNYEYIEAGEEPDGHIALVVVLADGYDRERLEGLDMSCLSGVYEKVFTPGIWTRH